MTEEQYNDDFFDVLGHLGLDATQINEANDYVLGRGTIEGAPGLKDEHLPVFDCATPGGKYGTRSIDWPRSRTHDGCSTAIHIGCNLKNYQYAIKSNSIRN